MNTEEQTLIDGLFGRLKQAEDPSQPRDAQAQACIEAHVRQQPAAPYYMAQAILVQEAAIKRLDEQNKQLEAELKQARAQAEAARAGSAPSNGGGGFLSSIFGSSGRNAAPAVQPQRPAAAPVASGGGWREPSAPGFSQPQVQQPGFGAAPARSGASSFLGGAMQTAAGVAGGVLLAQGISSLFNHNSQPEEVVEVIKEEPAPASDSGGWNDSGAQQQVADNSGWGSDQGGYADSDYGSDDGGFFSDDDSYV
ncbi:ABC transporter substrate-binding protein [Pseudomonas monteilii]|nr:ABC transporter substrate-binding protein [Pseudomonas monteilii]